MFKQQLSTKLLAAQFILSLVACSEIQQVSNSEHGAFGVDIAGAEDGSPAAIAWYDTRHQGADVYLRLLDGNLLPASQEWRLTDGSEQAYEPDVVLFGDSIAVVWYSESEDRFNTGQVYFALYDRSGNELHRVRLSGSDSDARVPVIAATDDALFVAWLEGAVNAKRPGRTGSTRQLMGVWLDGNGEVRGAAHALAPASPSTWNLNVAVADSAAARVLLVYDAEFETAVSELYIVDVTPEYSHLNRLTANDGYASKYPDLALSGESGESEGSEKGIAALTWFDELYGNNEIYLLQLPEEALLYSDVQNFLELQATRVTESDGDSIGAYVVWQDDRLALVWSEPVSRRYEIFYQLWDRTGSALTAATRLTSTRNDSYTPSISVQGNRLAVAWSEVSVVGPLRDAQLSRAEIAVQYLE